MKRARPLLFLSGACFVVAACVTSPLGRSQLLLFPESQLATMGATAFAELREQTPVERSARTNTSVRCVADAIVAELPRSQRWEVVVFKDDAANAFALPGGKIGIYTGLLRVAKNQDQLATVVAHEIAHVLASHANERVSTSYAAQTGAQLASVLASGGNTQAGQQLYGLLGLGAQVGILLPFSRAQESEADLMGLDLMAKAGFDPRQSVNLWENMANEGGARPPEFLSTHPSGTTRIRDLNARLRTALPTYEAAVAAGKRPRCKA